MGFILAWVEGLRGTPARVAEPTGGVPHSQAFCYVRICNKTNRLFVYYFDVGRSTMICGNIVGRILRRLFVPPWRGRLWRNAAPRAGVNLMSGATNY